MSHELSSVSGPTAYAWVRSVANALFWQDDSLWTGKEDVVYGDPAWMDWRSGSTVDAFIERARTFVPAEVWAAFESWDGEEVERPCDSCGAPAEMFSPAHNAVFCARCARRESEA